MSRKTCLALVTALAAPFAWRSVAQAQTPPPQFPNMTFFITSTSGPDGANFGGIEGADKHCQDLATKAGAGGKTWRAYLSTQAEGGKPAINARDRIGKGPWVNTEGEVVAASVDEPCDALARIDRRFAQHDRHRFGDEAIGLISCIPYTLDLETDGNKRFVDGMLKNFDTVPGQYAGLLYVNCQVVEAGLKALGGDASDKTKLVTAMRAVKLTDTPRGPVKFDHLGNVIGDFYIRKLGKEGAKYGLKYWNKTIKTYKDVSQFWTYDEKKFLEQPVYSRDYPPLKG